MRCKLCNPKRDIPIDEQNVVEHMIITKSKDGRYHIHGPLTNKQEVQTMIQVLCRETDLHLYTKTGVPLVQTKITTRNSEQVRLDSQYSTVKTEKYNSRLTMK